MGTRKSCNQARSFFARCPTCYYYFRCDTYPAALAALFLRTIALPLVAHPGLYP